jgi:hypothetical protein
VEHPFPGIELEGEFDSAVVEIDEFAVVAQADVLDIDQRGLKSGLARGILEVGEGAGVLGIFGHAGEMKVVRAAEFFPGIDQAFMDRIELIGALGDDVRSIPCSSQVHWNTAASKIEVGVSALYSSSFAGLRPSKLRSSRP